MARPDKVYVRFRGVVLADLLGLWGSAVPDLLCVDVDAAGLLVASAADVAKGVIWTPEGKSDSGVANFNTALAGSTMTVYVNAEFTGDFASPTLTAGEEVWSAAAGDVVDSDPGIGGQLIGFMAASAEGDPRFILNLGAISTATT